MKHGSDYRKMTTFTKIRIKHKTKSTYRHAKLITPIKSQIICRPTYDKTFI